LRSSSHQELFDTVYLCRYNRQLNLIVDVGTTGVVVVIGKPSLIK
jgi:hypothetical protein